MAIADISKWLEGDREYTSGLSLLEQHEPANVYLPFLKKGENSAFREKLISILSNLVPIRRRDNAVKDNGDKPSISTGPAEDQIPSPFKEEYRDSILRLFTARRMLNRDFREDQSDEERAAISRQLDEVQDDINDFYDRIRQYESTGNIVSHTKSLFQEYLDAEREVKKWREKISRVNKKDPDAAAQFEQRKAEAIERMEALAEKLHQIARPG